MGCSWALGLLLATLGRAHTHTHAHTHTQTGRGQAHAHTQTKIHPQIDAQNDRIGLQKCFKMAAKSKQKPSKLEMRKTNLKKNQNKMSIAPSETQKPIEKP